MGRVFSQGVRRGASGCWGAVAVVATAPPRGLAVQVVRGRAPDCGGLAGLVGAQPLRLTAGLWEELASVADEMTAGLLTMCVGGGEGTPGCLSTVSATGSSGGCRRRVQHRSVYVATRLSPRSRRMEPRATAFAYALGPPTGRHPIGPVRAPRVGGEGRLV